MTLSRSPKCRAFSRAVMDEKSLSPLLPVGGPGIDATVSIGHSLWSVGVAETKSK